MCGIAGIAGVVDSELIQSMAGALAHRGPDGEGYFVDDGIALGHRRLAIIDLETGAQPMSVFSGRFWIVFNGEIYNYRELRQELSSLGFQFHTNSDTEVLLTAYACWGHTCLAKIQGMFAFAIWDKSRQHLFVARDPVGIKPLYYAQTPQAFYFASEIKALLECPAITRALDLESLDDYLTYLYTVPPRTFYRGIKQLPPGYYGIWSNSRFITHRYWKPSCTEGQEFSSEDEVLEAVEHLIQTSISRCCIADVPLGAFLSGGLDSAAIVTYMAKEFATPLTFTVGFEKKGGSLYDETPEARKLAALLGTKHHELRVTAEVANLLPQMVWHFDEPFGNPTALLTWSISELVKQHVKVVLSGDGGDEAFGGYPRYRGAAWAEYYRLIPAPIRRVLINPLVQMLPESTTGFHGLRRLKEFSAGSLLDPVDMYALWHAYYTQEDKKTLYTPDVARVLAGREAREYIKTLANECDSQDTVSRAMYIDCLSFLPNNVLQYSDRMSMAHALEVRVPLADAKLLEFMLQIPGNLKICRGKSKYLLRKVLERYLPPQITNRKKIGFNPPMGAWLNGPLKDVIHEYLSPENIQQGGFFEPDAVSRLLIEHRHGRRDHTWRIWALIVFEQWRRQYHIT